MRKLLSVLLISLLLLTACTPKDETAGSTATDSDLVINTDSDLTVMGEAEIGQVEGSSNVKLPDAIEEAPPEFYEDTKNDVPPDQSVSSDGETSTPDSNSSSSAGATEPGYEGDSTAPYDPNTPEIEIIESNADMTTF